MTTIETQETMKTRYIVFIFLFPILYFVNSFTPWSQEFWGNNNHDYYLTYWTSVIILHWVSVLLALFFLKKSNLKLSDVGFNLRVKGRIILFSTFLLISIGILFLTEWSLNYVSIDVAKLNNLNNFYPRTLIERIFWILFAFSIGFCEEFIYRGFCIKMLESKGISKWIAILIAALPFVFIHGYTSITSIASFAGYLIFGLVFGLIFVLSKRLWIPMIIHMLFYVWAMMAIFQCISRGGL